MKTAARECRESWSAETDLPGRREFVGTSGSVSHLWNGQDRLSVVHQVRSFPCCWRYVLNRTNWGSVSSASLAVRMARREG